MSKTDQVTLQVTGMTCPSCTQHVEAALLKVSGVSHAVIEYSEGLARVTGTRPDLSALTAAVQALGYQAAPKEVVMSCKKLAGRFPRSSLRSLLLGVAALSLSNAVLAYDFSKLETAFETLSPETINSWEQKAHAGNALAQNVVGVAYKCGIGVKQDHAASVKWFRMAAEQGEADAQFNLARLYGSEVNGAYKKARAVPANDEEALKWYQRSAEQGHTQAQVKLAEMYADGADKGLHVQGFVLAYKWLSLAAAAGEPTAKELIQVYSTRMEPEQVAEAESLAQEWLNQKRAS